MKMFPTTINLIGLPLVLLTALTLPAGAAAPSKDETKKSATSFEFNKKDPIYITADWMEADQTKSSITYKGRVVTVQNEMTMRSETLKAYYDPKTKQIRQIIAEGKVNATQGNRVATGEKAVFDDKTKTVTLTGNPVMRQGNNQVSGVKVIYFTEQDRSIVEGDKNTRVIATIFPDELKGEDSTGGAQKE